MDDYISAFHLINECADEATEQINEKLKQVNQTLKKNVPKRPIYRFYKK